MPKNKHVFLINPQSVNPEFNRQRGRDNDKQKDDDTQENPQPKLIHEFQKERLRRDNAELYSQRRVRNNNRTIQFSKIIDLVRINFFCVFNDDLKKKFYQRYGLSPVEYSHFNKTVMFEVTDERLFQNFIDHVQQVISSAEGTSYEGQSFNLIALVLQFEFFSSRSRVLTAIESGILLVLISSANLIYSEQKAALFQYLRQQNIAISYNASSPDIIEVNVLSREQRELIAGNFDIVKAVTSARALKIRSGVYGTVRREFGFEVIIPSNITTVGVIDTGVSNLEPFRDLIVNPAYDHTGNGAFWDEAGHGTLVAGLVAFGEDLPNEVRDSYEAKAKVLVIKALHNTNDSIDIPRLLADIRDAKQNHGVRLFNMSLNLPFAKQYNSAYGQFAYELDKLAYEEDILIFISVGNINDTYLQEMLETDVHPDHEYPTFFYKPDSTSTFHTCRNTNISEPSESLNNISVGALAGNLEDGDNSDITPNSLSPAYYTRKFHLDYSQQVNGGYLQKNQKNKYLNKPDLVFDGGDLFNVDSGIEILTSQMVDTDKYYGRTCGTILATPLIASYAAEILNTYPSLRPQTVKAILINSASYYKKSELPDFAASTDTLIKRLTGFGIPQRDGLLFTDNNSITFIVEKTIKHKEIIGIPLYLPEYLKLTGNKLKFDITLCYSFMPVKDNHLNYLPMHMSINLVRNVDMTVIAKQGQTEYGIKNSFIWSEDHFGLENRLFSNAQFVTRNLQPKDIISVDGSIVLGVRCLVKSDIPNMAAYTENKEHPFSVVVKITELLPENKASNQLYNEMIACNKISNISEAIADAEADAEAN